jgi:hypothetical protein
MAREAATIREDQWSKAAASKCPELSPEDGMQTLKLNLSLIGIAQSVKSACSYGAPEAMKFILEGNPPLLR